LISFKGGRKVDRVKKEREREKEITEKKELCKKKKSVSFESFNYGEPTRARASCRA